MAKRRHTAEQIISKLREAEVSLAPKPTAPRRGCKDHRPHPRVRLDSSSLRSYSHLDVRSRYPRTRGPGRGPVGYLPHRDVKVGNLPHGEAGMACSDQGMHPTGRPSMVHPDQGIHPIGQEMATPRWGILPMRPVTGTKTLNRGTWTYRSG